MGMPLLERLQLAECHAVHGPDVTEAINLIAELEAKLERQREIYHNQRDTMEGYEKKLARVRWFATTLVIPEDEVALLALLGKGNVK